MEFNTVAFQMISIMHTTYRCFCIVTLVLVTSSYSITGAKILMVPSDHPAHVNFNLVIGRALKEAGHQVHVLTVDRHQKAVDKFGLASHIVQAVKGRNPFEAEYEMVQGALFSESTSRLFDVAAKVFEAGVELCKEFLENDMLMEILKTEDFDFAVMDGSPPTLCNYIIPYKLGLRYITLLPLPDPWKFRVAAMPSVDPFFLFMYYEQDPSFLERLSSLFMYSVHHLNTPPSIRDDTLIEKYAPEKPSTTFSELYLDSEMVLVNMENICLDRPRVSAPHYLFVGGINTQPAKQLPRDLEDFVKNADKGVILVTFGSAIKRPPAEIFEKMMWAFAKLEQKVLMRFDGNATGDVAPNVKLSKWLPQNDILGHKNTRLFITHAGNNGQLEALYHGVPMLAMPVALDQHRNARRSEHRGYGKTVNPYNFEADELLSTINELLDTPSYTEKIKHCSAIYRDFPSPQSTVVFYVEHVLKFGGTHLKPAYLRMPLWQFFMLDVLAFLLVSILVVVALMFCVTHAMFRRCCSSSTKKKRE